MRSGDTYRGDRRNMWGALKGMPWVAYNGMLARDAKGVFGPVLATAHSTVLGRSKYIPHQGKREMERRRKRALGIAQGKTGTLAA